MRKEVLRNQIWDHKFCLPGICNINKTKEFWESVAKRLLNSTKFNTNNIKDAINKLKDRIRTMTDKDEGARINKELVKYITEDLTL